MAAKELSVYQSLGDSGDSSDYSYLVCGDGHSTQDTGHDVQAFTSGYDQVMWTWFRLLGTGRINAGNAFCIQDGSNGATMRMRIGISGTSSGSTPTAWGVRVERRSNTTNYQKYESTSARSNFNDRNTFVAAWWDESATTLRVFIADDAGTPLTEITSWATNAGSGTGHVGTSTGTIVWGSGYSGNLLGWTFDGPVFRTGCIEADGPTETEVMAFLGRVVADDIARTEWSTLDIGPTTETICAYQGEGVWDGSAYDLIALPASSETKAMDDESGNGYHLFTYTSTSYNPAQYSSNPLTVTFPGLQMVDVAHPTHYRVLQRDDISDLSAGTTTVRVRGTVLQPVDTHLWVQAGGTFASWTQVPSDQWTGTEAAVGSTFYVDVEAAPGQGVRFGEGSASPSSAFEWTHEAAVGDIIAVYGQSNAGGTDVYTTPVLRHADTYTGGDLYGGLLTHKETSGVYDWQRLREPTGYRSGGHASSLINSAAFDNSAWAAACGLVMSWTGLPMAVVNVARGNQAARCLRRGYSYDSAAPATDASWDTGNPASECDTLFEYLIRAAQQIKWQVNTGGTDDPADANGTSPDYYADATGRGGGGGTSPLAGAWRAVLYLQGETNAAVDSTYLSTDFPVDLEAIADDIDKAFNTGSPPFDTAVVLSTIGDYIEAQAPSADLMTARDMLRACRDDNTTGIVTRGPDLYDIYMTGGDAAESVHFASNPSADTLLELIKRSALALYGELLVPASVQANYRGPKITGASVDDANDRIDLTVSGSIDTESSDYADVVVVHDDLNSGNALTHADPPASSTQVSVKRQDATTLRVQFYTGTDLSAAATKVKISVGYGHAPSGGQDVPKRTVTVDYPTIVAEVGGTNLKGYWRFGEASGNFADSSGNSHTLTASGTPGYAANGALPQDSNKGCDLGGGDYGSVATHADFETAAVTMCGWLKPLAHNQTTRTIISKLGGGAGHEVKLHTNDTLRLVVNGSTDITSTFVPPVNEWTFWAAVIQNGSQKLYVMDRNRWFREIGSGTTATITPNTSSSVVVGDSADAVGVVDEVCWFNAALSTSSLQRIGRAFNAYPLSVTVPIEPYKNYAPQAGGTTYTVNLSGSVTPTGAVVKEARAVKTGSLTPTGATAKQAAKSTGGTLAPSGMVRREARMVLAGAVGLAGTVAAAKLAVLAVAGTVAPAGGVVRQVQTRKAGSLTPTGALIRQVQVRKGGAVTPTGSLTRQALKVLAGAVTPAGTLTNQTTGAGLFFLSVAGAITPTGTLRRDVRINRAGAVAPAGTLAKTARRSFSGSVAPSGTLATSKLAVLALAGTLMPAGTLRKTATLVRTGTVTPTGSIAKQPQIRLAGAIAPAGSTAKLILRTLAGVITPSGAHAGSLIPGGSTAPTTHAGRPTLISRSAGQPRVTEA